MCVVASIAMKCEVNSSFRINVDYFLNTILLIVLQSRLFLGETRAWKLSKHRWKNNKSLFEQEEALSKDQTHMGRDLSRGGSEREVSQKQEKN